MVDRKDMLWLRHMVWVLPLTGVALCIIILMLPNSITSSNKLLRKAKGLLLKGWKRAVFLTKEGPMWRVIVWGGKKFGLGWLSSLPRPPTNIKAKSTSVSEVFLWWIPNLPPYNPFHEEEYVAQWRLADGGEDDKNLWHTKTFNTGDWEEDGRKMKLCVDSLPESTNLQFRIAAMNKKGRGDWSKPASAITFAQPEKDGGLWGPLGPAAEFFTPEKQKYQWTQMRGDVNIKIPIPDEWKSTNIRFSKTPMKINMSVIAPSADSNADPQVLLAGSFPHRAKIDQIFWQIEDTKEDGRHIEINITKEDPLVQWPCIFDEDDHPKIDSSYVRLLTDGMDDKFDWLKENTHSTKGAWAS
jgi:hypothetical protein